MQLKVFYLDDEVELTNIFKDDFSSDEILIRTFVDPDLLISAIAVDRPDILFLDLRLPGTNGDDIACELALDLPVYLVSGDISVRPKYRFRQVFPKPYCFEDIQSLLHHHVLEKHAAAVG